MTFRVQKGNRVYSLSVSELLKMLFRTKHTEHIDVKDVHEDKLEDRKDNQRV